MLDTVHIDEKWCYVSQPTVKAYLAPDEEEPHRAATKSKQFITKVNSFVRLHILDGIQEPTDTLMESLESGPLWRKSLPKEPPAGTEQEEP
jgi:hypothetical protein